MKISVIVIILALAFIPACVKVRPVKSGTHTIEDVLIKKGFVDDNTYQIVCRGYPQEGLAGIQKIESSKRAALLNAYYFVKNTFGESVAPDRDGKADKFDIAKDFAVVHYILKKNGLKKMTVEK